MKLVVTNDSSGWGGTQNQIVLLARGLRERGHEVVVCCRPRGALRAALDRFEISTSTRRIGGDLDFVAALRFAAWLRRERPDALLVTTWKKLFWTGWAARRGGVRRVATFLGNERPAPHQWRYRYAFHHYVDTIIANAEGLREHWLRAAPWFPAERVHVVLNGVPPEAPALGSVRTELGVSADVPIIAAVGRLVPQKGFDVLLEAFAAMSNRQAYLAIAGEGEEGSALRARAEQLGITDRLRWLGFRQDIPAVLAACDVFALSSRWEGMAFVLIEALMAGTPVVATDVSGVREALGPGAGAGAGALIVPPRNPAELAAALDATLANLASARRGADAARRRAEHRFSVDRMVEETGRILFDGASGSR